MRVRLSAAADVDLNHILQQGLDQFGPSQLSDYMDGLERLFGLLAQFPHMGLERPEISVGLRSHAYRSHIIFYRVEESAIYITRIRHGREDWQD